ncbi:MAG TPA: hypothetical protein V6C96_04360 [Vampirovibrionales bacterium]
MLNKNSSEVTTSLSHEADCSSCGAIVCQRAFTMNLAFGNDEDPFCIKCLAINYGQEKRALFKLGLNYVMNRECFEKAWNKQKEAESCPLKDSCCFDLCFSSDQ